MQMKAYCVKRAIACELQGDLETYNKWCKINKLNVNSLKKFMIFSKRNNKKVEY